MWISKNVEKRFSAVWFALNIVKSNGEAKLQRRTREVQKVVRILSRPNKKRCWTQIARTIFQMVWTQMNHHLGGLEVAGENKYWECRPRTAKEGFKKEPQDQTPRGRKWNYAYEFHQIINNRAISLKPYMLVWDAWGEQTLIIPTPWEVGGTFKATTKNQKISNLWPDRLVGRHFFLKPPKGLPK